MSETKLDEGFGELKVEEELIKTRKDILSEIYYNKLKQTTELLFSYNYGNEKWSKWIEFVGSKDIEINKATHRSIGKIEIIIDIDGKTQEESKVTFDKIIKLINEKNYSYKAYFTGSKGYHIHFIFEELINYTSNQRKKIRENFISMLDIDKNLDYQKSIERCMIALEDVPHWKSGKIKKIILQEEKGKNKLPEFDLNKQPNIKNNISSQDNFYGGDDKYKELRNKIFNHLAKKHPDRDSAIEELVKYVHENYTIKTVRDNKNPEIYMFENGIYNNNALTIITELIRNVLKSRYSTQFSNAALERIKNDTWIDHSEFFKPHPKHLMPCSNGVYDLKQKKLIQYSELKEDYFFKGKFNVSYNIHKLESIEEFVNNFFNINDESSLKDKLTLQEVVGLCFYNHIGLHNFCIFYGGGRNGKGTLLRMLTTMLNNFCSEVDLDKFTDKDGAQNFHLADLINKSANLAGDIKGGVFPYTALLKKTTGDDRISAKVKNIQDPIQFTPAVQNIFSCNDLPIFSDSSTGFWERLTLIKFEKKTFVSSKDIEDYKKDGRDITKYALKKDEKEFQTKDFLEKFFYWGLLGLNRVLSNNRFSNHKHPELKRKEYIALQNPVIHYIEKYFEEDIMGEIDVHYFNSNLNYYINEKVKETGNLTLKKNLNQKIKAALIEIGVFKEQRGSTRSWKILGLKEKINTENVKAEQSEQEEHTFQSP